MIFSNLAVKPFPDTHEFNICTTEVVSPLCFYAHLINKDTLTALHELNSLLVGYATCETTPFTPKVNEICVAKFDDDKKWYRAMLVSYVEEERKAKVFFIDYGNEETVDVTNIRCINKQLLKFPRFLMKFAIAGITETTSQLTEIVKSSLLNKQACVTCVLTNVLTDTMKCNVICDTGEDLYVKLMRVSSMLTNLSINQSINQSIKRIMFDDLPLQNVNTTNEFEALIFAVNNTRDICGWIGDLSSIKHHIEQISVSLFDALSYPSSQYFPIVGEVCAVYNELPQEWYRVHIHEVHYPEHNNNNNKSSSSNNNNNNNNNNIINNSDNKRNNNNNNPEHTVTGKLIDYGNIFKMKCQHLARLPDEKFCSAAEAMSISLEGVDDLKTRLDVLKEKLELHKVLCTVSKYTDRYIVNKMVVVDSGEDIFDLLSVKTLDDDEVDTKLSSEINGKHTTNVRLYDKDVDICEEKIELFTKKFNEKVSSQCVQANIYDTTMISPIEEKSFSQTIKTTNYDKVTDTLLLSEINEVDTTNIHDEKIVLITEHKVTEKVSLLSDKIAQSLMQGICKEDVSLFSNRTGSSTRFPSISKPNEVQVESKENHKDDSILSHDRLTTMPSISVHNKVQAKSKEDHKDDVLMSHKIDCLTATIGAPNNCLTETPPISIPNECNIKVTFVESQNKIYGYVLDSDMGRKYAAMYIHINIECSKINTTHYIPSLNEFVFVWLNGWNRALVHELDGQKAKVYLIDNGNTRYVTFDMIRQCFKKEFVQIPSFLVNFQLDVSALFISSVDTMLLKSKLENKSFHIFVVKRMENTITAKIVDNHGDDICNHPDFFLKSVKQIDSNNVEYCKSQLPMGLHSNNVEYGKSQMPLRIHRDNAEYRESSLPFGMHPLETIDMKIDITALPKNMVNFRITHIISPYLLYGASTDTNVVMKHIQMLKELSLDCTTSNFNDIKVEAGVLCACKYPNLSWQRGIIIEVAGSQCCVFLIDIGSTINVPMNLVKPLDRRFQNLYAQAIPIRLGNVKPLHGHKDWSKDAIDFFRELLIGKTVHVLPICKKGVITTVRLKLDQNNDRVNELLVSAGYAEFCEPSTLMTDSGLSKKTSESSTDTEINSLPKESVIWRHLVRHMVKMESFDAGDSFDALITCVTSPQMFFGCIFTKTCRIDEMSLKLNNLYEGQWFDNSDLKVGDLCAAKHDGNWYRAYIVAVQPSMWGCDLWFLDFGMSKFIYLENLRILPQSMYKYPVQTLMFQVHNIVPIADNQHSDVTIKKFKSLVLDRVMRIKVMQRNGLLHHVIIHDAKSGVDVSEILVRQGLVNYENIKAPKNAVKSCNNICDKISEDLVKRIIEKNVIQYAVHPQERMTNERVAKPCMENVGNLFVNDNSQKSRGRLFNMPNKKKSFVPMSISLNSKPHENGQINWFWKY